MNAICSICGSSVTVQDSEGTAFCYTCENEGLHTRIKELEAALVEAVPADPAERTLRALEILVGPLMWDTVMRRFHDKSGKERSVEIGRRTLDASRSALRYFIDDVKVARADALALLGEETE